MRDDDEGGMGVCKIFGFGLGGFFCLGEIHLFSFFFFFFFWHLCGDGRVDGFIGMCR
jgi:hypothetical protein